MLLFKNKKIISKIVTDYFKTIGDFWDTLFYKILIIQIVISF